MRSAAPRSLYLDYAVGICSVWIAAGFFLDAWAHGHVPIESFFTPYHALFYTGMLAITVAIFTLQVIAATLWFRRFQFGPVEYLWRRAAYL